MTRRIAALAFAIAILATGLPLATAAQAALGGWGISPADGSAYFDLDAAPGDTFDLPILIQNGTEDPMTLALGVVPSVASVRGGFDYAVNPGDGLADCASWASLAEVDFQLAPGEARLTTLHLEVPQDAAAGIHQCGLVAALPPEPAPSGMAVVIVARSGLPIIVDIAGPRYCGMTVQGVKVASDPTGWSLVVEGQNSGNAPFQGSGRLTASMDGQRVVDAPLTVGRVGGFGQSLVYPVPLEGSPATYAVTVDLQGEDGCTAAWSGPVTIARADAQEHDQEQRQRALSTALDWLAGHGDLLLLLGIIGLLVGLALAVLLVILRAKGGGSRL